MTVFDPKSHGFEDARRAIINNRYPEGSAARSEYQDGVFAFTRLEVLTKGGEYLSRDGQRARKSVEDHLRDRRRG